MATGLPQRVLGGAALACVAFSCAWAICLNVGGNSGIDTGIAKRSDPLVFAASRGDRLVLDSSPKASSGPVSLADFDSRFTAAFPPGVFLGSKPLEANIAAGDQTSVAAAPSPSEDRRVAEVTPAAAPLSLSPRPRRHVMPRLAELERAPEAAASSPASKPSLLERLFGRSPPSIFEKLFGPSKLTLAYASPTDGVANDEPGITSGLYDRQTAVYDISAHTVYLPDGTTLEAHSGYGARLDNPRYAAVRDLGPTPPDIYDLRPRGQLFHGVHALRLIPVDERKVFGRSGLLAHTYMLGPSGQSNGCVSFKDYNTFLQAYENHEITRLAVVSHL